MKRAMAIVAGVIAFAACTSAQSGGLSVDPALVEMRVIVLQCGGLYGQHEVTFNPADYWVTTTYFGPPFRPRPHGSRAMGDLDHYIEFHIDSDPSWKMRIDWRAQQTYSAYFITQEHDGKTETVDAGFCRESRESPQLPPQFDRVMPTANAQGAEIKVVVPETATSPAVISVTGYFAKGDNMRFFDAVEKIKSATVYFESLGGNASAGVGIGEIIHQRSFRTAVLNLGSCMSACALAWLGGAKRYIGDGADVGFHTPFVRNKVKVSETLTIWTTETTTSGRDIVADYVVRTLGLKKEAADFVMEAPPQSFTYLTHENTDRVGIAFTRMSIIPAYKPLP